MSSLLWFALPPSSPVSQRPSLRLRLTPLSSTPPMAMVLIHTHTPDSTTDMLVTLTLTTARDLLMLRLSLRLRLIRGWLMVMVTHMLTEDTELTDTDTLMFTDTTARGPLIPSPRLMLMPTMVSMAMDWVTTDWDTELTDTLMLTTATTTARGPLTPSLMPMPTMATMATPGPTDTDTDTEDTEDTTTDKFSGPEIQSRSSKRTSLLVI